MAIILQHTNESNKHAVHLKFMQHYVKYISIEKKMTEETDLKENEVMIEGASFKRSRG